MSAWDILAQSLKFCRIWKRRESFLSPILVILIGLFMHFIDGRQFLLSHHLVLTQVDGSVTSKLMFQPVQSDITTIISILASTARVLSTLWAAGLDLRFIFLFMQRGGITFEGLKSMPLYEGSVLQIPGECMG